MPHVQELVFGARVTVARSVITFATLNAEPQNSVMLAPRRGVAVPPRHFPAREGQHPVDAVSVPQILKAE